jgi:hypothetical protein
MALMCVPEGSTGQTRLPRYSAHQAGSVTCGSTRRGTTYGSSVADPAELEDLAHRAAAGDRVALEELLAEPRVRRICGRMLLFPEDAEEAAQDALLLVATKIGGFEGRSRFTTWLHAVASAGHRQVPHPRRPDRRAAAAARQRLTGSPTAASRGYSRSGSPTLDMP